MARVRLLKRMAGPEGNWGVGQVVEVSAEVAEMLVSGGFAERADPPAPAVETATRKAPERATAKRQRSSSPSPTASRRRTKKSGGDE